MLFLLNKLIWEEGGQGMVEYGFLLSLVALVLVGTLVFLGETIVTFFYEKVRGHLILSDSQG